MHNPESASTLREKGSVVMGRPIRVILEEPGVFGSGIDNLRQLKEQFGELDNITFK